MFSYVFKIYCNAKQFIYCNILKKVNPKFFKVGKIWPWLEPRLLWSGSAPWVFATKYLVRCTALHANISIFSADWTKKNICQLKSEKYKELCILCTKNRDEITPLHIDGQVLRGLESVKLFGVTIPNNRTWNVYVNDVLKKATIHPYFLKQLKCVN